MDVIEVFQTVSWYTISISAQVKLRYQTREIFAFTPALQVAANHALDASQIVLAGLPPRLMRLGTVPQQVPSLQVPHWSHGPESAMRWEVLLQRSRRSVVLRVIPAVDSTVTIQASDRPA
jgi:hypothetical protein